MKYSNVRVVLGIAICMAGLAAQGEESQKGPAVFQLVRQTVVAEGTADIVDITVADGEFKTLAKALEAASLVDTLRGKGPFTVFAPTDEAFAKLPAGTVDDLLKPENKEKLKAILLLHVVPGVVHAADVAKLKEAKAAGGNMLMVAVPFFGKVKVGTATGMSHVTNADIQTTNGVIHVIDAVILP
jgi:uncharacterized surface protein with fasciclin (FAS1) repeats